MSTLVCSSVRPFRFATLRPRTTLGLIGCSSLALALPMSADAEGFLEDSKATLNLRNAYFNRNFVNPAYPQRSFEGEITEIDSRVDPTTRNVRVRARLPNKDDALRSGMSFQVKLELPGQAYVSVPELALQWGRNGSFVWAVRNGNAVQVAARPVRRTVFQGFSPMRSDPAPRDADCGHVKPPSPAPPANWRWGRRRTPASSSPPATSPATARPTSSPRRASRARSRTASTSTPALPTRFRRT